MLCYNDECTQTAASLLRNLDSLKVFGCLGTVYVLSAALSAVNTLSDGGS